MPKTLIIIPAYKIRAGSKEYLLDAFFIDNRLDFPCRRALLIFRLEEARPHLPAVDRKIVIKSRAEPEKAVELLREALEWTEKMRLELARKTFRRFRIALLIPVLPTPKRLEENIRGEKIPEEWELNGALHILKNIIFTHGSDTLPTVLGLDRIAIVIDYSREEPEIVWAPAEMIKKNYSWLMKNDDMFRRTIKKILRGRKEPAASSKI